MGLFEPIWKTHDERELWKALAAVHETSDPKKLLNIVMNAGLSKVRYAALVQISDPQILKELILAESTAYDMRRAAVKRISDPAVLTEIAMQRQAYPADGDAVAMIRDPELLRQIALSGQGGEQDQAVFRITDQRILAEIAVRAEKGDARKTAICVITDPDILLDILDSTEDSSTRTKVHERLKELITSPEKPGFSEEQRERCLQAIINEKDRNVRIELMVIDDAEGYERIFQQAARYDLKAAALAYLVLQEDYPADRLLSHWKTAEQNRKTVQNTFSNPWQDAQMSVEDRLEIEEINRPSLRLDFVSDPEVGSVYAAKCIKALFDEKFSAYEEIKRLREESFAAYLRNIPAYAEQDQAEDVKPYLVRLIEAVPEEFRSSELRV